jgi:hypothetical protein
VAVTVAMVKARLNKTLTVDDGEIQEMLDAAVAEYESLIGPLTAQTFTQTVRRGIFPRFPVVSVKSATDLHGSALDLTDIDSEAFEAGLFRNVHGRSYPAARVTYTAGYVTVPAHIREAIAADVAGYFAVTQRGSTVGALPAGAAGFYTPEGTGTPLVLFPRIRALAPATVA